jgi:hypothetical protein
MTELKQKISTSDTLLVRERAIKIDPTYFQRDSAIKQLANEFGYTELAIRNFVLCDSEVNFPLTPQSLNRKQRREKAVIKYLLIFCSVAVVIALVVSQMPYRNVPTTSPVPSVFDTSATQSSGSSKYGSCEATLQPKLEACLEVQPQENWGLCRATYLGALEECMKRK